MHSQDENEFNMCENYTEKWEEWDKCGNDF